MNLPELITKLLLIERQLIEDGVDVNSIKVSYKDNTLDTQLVQLCIEENNRYAIDWNMVTYDYIEIDNVYIDKKEVQLS